MREENTPEEKLGPVVQRLGERRAGLRFGTHSLAGGCILA